MLKNLIFYYLIAIVPLGVLIWLFKAKEINSYTFVGLIFFYALIYRTYVDGKRLYDKQIIPKKDIWKMIIPGRRAVFFKELYFKK